MTRSLSLLLIAILAVSSGGEILPATVADPAPAPTTSQLIGQKLVVRMDGAIPSTDLLGRIQRGEVGGVILFGSNITTPEALVELTGELQAAALAGGQPPLLIAVDQEGGSIKRISWAPPNISPRHMGRIGLTSVARAQGAATGAALHDLGINVDLAPVADVPATTASFLYLQRRTFSFDPVRTTALANAFASGLKTGGVVAVMKHFPGLGFAKRDTDSAVVRIHRSAAELAPGLSPYVKAIGRGIPMIMLSNATYGAYDPDAAAGWSHAISVTLLRHQLGFRGVTITDSLNGTAKARGGSATSLAVLAADAGTDMILLTGSEASSAKTYAALVQAATDGLISPARLRYSYRRILALKSTL